MSKRTSIQDDETLILPPKAAKAQHTPGPWIVKTLANGVLRIGNPNQVGPVAIADMLDQNSVARANASLIAAAPELLEALRSASAYLAQYAKYHASQSAVAHNVISLVDAAIAKAEGKS